MSEFLITIKIEPLEEGGFLATSEAIQGLVAQGRTIAETMEIAQDVAKKIIESYIEHGDPLPFDIKSSKKPSKQELKIPISVSL
ncbi:MAG: type II toxin-antitoxin system HicB family antitoxin [Candidatus Aminicenantes bacterium]|nr:MAG: type II toxin-antitoxin system HicB family antitoxin [Candidatus Aminicenantes bacterium]